jgi:uncharacterized protein with GYD domain
MAPGGDSRPKYVTFFSYTREATKGMIDRASDRTAAAKSLVESLGGSLEAFYWMHGDHDGFLIANFPDGTGPAALAAAVGSTGSIARMESHEVFDRDAQMQILKAAKAGVGSYKAPTA